MWGQFLQVHRQPLVPGAGCTVRAFNERRLDEEYPFVLVDALFIRCRHGDRVVQRAALIVTGINSEGYRQILGVRIGDTESAATWSETTWSETFAWLKRRGLKGVMFVVSDSHGGLREALGRHFQGASWQRCQVHLLRNVLGHCSHRVRAEVAEAAKLVLQAPDMAEARRRMQDFADQFAKSAPKAVACLQGGFEDAMAVMSLPSKYRKRLRTTNIMERQDREIRRRERVIGIFPNDESAHRLIGALLAETNEKWLGRRYLDTDEFKDWRAEQDAGTQGNNVVALGE